MKVISIILVVFGGIIVLLNASIPVRYYLLNNGKRSYSCIPVLGGLMVFLGMLMWDNALVNRASFLALFIDIGCVPMIVFALYKLLKGGYKD